MNALVFTRLTRTRISTRLRIRRPAVGKILEARTPVGRIPAVRTEEVRTEEVDIEKKAKFKARMHDDLEGRVLGGSCAADMS